jgi:hypothetical protein
MKGEEQLRYIALNPAPKTTALTSNVFEPSEEWNLSK